jgi:hypothetical protein
MGLKEAKDGAAGEGRRAGVGREGEGPLLLHPLFMMLRWRRRQSSFTWREEGQQNRPAKDIKKKKAAANMCIFEEVKHHSLPLFPSW